MPALPHSDRTSRAEQTERDPRWPAVLGRDPSQDGHFVYGVRTTGVYCRPSCPARLARPENVSFHRSCEEAEAAGLRPCRRCRPEAESRAEEQARLVAAACRRIDAAAMPPALETLAREAGLSPFHFHRLFRSVAGLTPRAYAEAARNRRLRLELDRPDGTVTEAIYDAGFSSSSRFYERTDAVLGMTPTAYRSGGPEVEIRFAVGECSLGSILVGQTPKGVCAILIGDDPDALARDLQDRFPKARLIGGDAGFEAVVASVVGLVEAPGLGLDLPLDLRGTAFQERVWQALRLVPAGETVSYKDLARRIGEPRSVRAVARACGANKVAVAIPCHRVVRSDGALSGYRWGVDRKRALLDREARAAAGEPRPAP
ncbi:bifunctional DNA-binding transcriptional regulator/O6-methylguanine-DNA methyltransferase Ada [Enterovirga sp.]|uniref:bifunctional DNA-binding transcriptional regulator/O6-methylguanine-DNA methyltransferase Ada n=1 Tax=Enterovirga sp. TaxID=2026350 RepID=UPI00262396AD|nr:bifunctional DNA-binding transcriptional regulator/O6-methylguanine-DNA methyltransferase Ada [Enterovirga sp.]MDB5592914.1 ada [Enterovirga sp.]